MKRRESILTIFTLNNGSNTPLLKPSINRVRVEWYAVSGIGFVNVQPMTGSNQGIVITTSAYRFSFDKNDVGSLVTQPWYGFATAGGQIIACVETFETNDEN